MTDAGPTGKHHAWVELYFDLVFVFAVAQLSHLIVDSPDWPSLLLAFGLYLPLWWTWIGFVVLYNRHGEDRPSQRLLLLAGTVPCAFFAVRVYGAGDAELVGVALALAGTRLVLALAYPLTSGEGISTARRTGLGYLLSTVLFGLSALLPIPWIFVVWGVTLAQEASFLLLSRQGSAQSDRALDSAHLSERFNLFMIIMLGELVISVGGAAADLSTQDSSMWFGLGAGLVLAGALWWIYFDAAAPLNAAMLKASGGSPTLAYGIYAGGYVLPTFALLAIAAGCKLALQPEAPAAAVWLVTGGLAAYLVGIRAFVPAPGSGRRYLVRVSVVAATISLALLELVLAGPIVVWIAAIWAAGVAVGLTNRRLSRRPWRLAR